VKTDQLPCDSAPEKGLDRQNARNERDEEGAEEPAGSSVLFLPGGSPRTDPLASESLTGLTGGDLRFVSAAAVIYGLIVVLALWSTAPAVRTGSWLVLLLATIAIRLWLVGQWQQHREIPPTLLRVALMVMFAISGTVWGLASFLDYPVFDLGSQAVVAVVQIVVMAGAMMSLYRTAGYFEALAVPIVLLSLIRLTGTGEEVELLLGLLILVFFVILNIGAMRWRYTAGERDTAEQTIRAREHQLATVVNAVPVFLGYLDRTFRYRFVNRSYLEAFSQPEAYFLNQRVDEVLGEEVFKRVRSRLQQALAGEVQQFELSMAIGGGEARVYSIQYVPDRRPDGSIPGVFTMATDITAYKQVQDALSHRAAHDPLTGLPNRREIEYQLSRLLKQETADNGHCFCYVDLDGFKQVNDSAGHQAGDAMLREVGQLMANRLRTADTAGRLGGDEFALILRNCTLEDGRRIAEDLVETIEAFRFDWQGGTYRVGASIGLTTLDRGQLPTVEDVMAAADAALYLGKQQGRGKVVVWEPGLQAAAD
jgi:diguanylate cyclase (GGDEF)-like protein/PAS domain S-box-containing protein